MAAQQALDEGAEIILGPLFAQSVGVVAQVARTRNMPVIAFSTDANVASRGVYLLSFLPEIGCPSASSNTPPPPGNARTRR